MTLRKLIREMLLQEDEATRRMNTNLATRTVVNAWLDLGMSAGSDPERYHNIFDNKKSLVEGDWQAIESFVKRLP